MDYIGEQLMKRQLYLAISVTLLGFCGPALAITDSESTPSYPLNFANPGARSMGMGGAFIGLADDATAAYANPAGLTQLVKPEVSVEARRTDYSIPYVNGGTATTSPFNGSGLDVTNQDSSKSNLSFISLVYPHGRWSFAFYRDEALRFDTNYQTSLTGVPVDGGNTGTVFPVDTSANLKTINYGFSAAFKASDNVSLGVGVSYYDFHINTLTNRLAPVTPNNTITNPGAIVNSQAEFGSDNDYGLNLGARFVLSEKWSAGLVYRRGPEFKYSASNSPVNSVLQFNADGTATFIPPTDQSAFIRLSNVSFKMPDQYGAGISWRPNDAWVVNFDADFIDYSQLTRGIQSLYGNDPTVVSRLSISNGTELHLGAEYTFTQMSHPFSLRAGVWHDPRHSIQFKGDPGSDVGAIPLAVLFYGTKGSQTHSSVGFGWAFTNIEIDGAADFSDLTDIYSVSAIYRF